ncbi:glutamine-hydrolyzing carbamoyl-phosphate synthase small subunit [Corynebacterium uberis]|uniref:glutamine-hydrolyzing carbamoyl-phosphate synthase small subunit n=1 Tax=Corynebacterium uberis TaxID=2883169 RepID=UPI001D0B139A|nr:glutamine-hydrolyzing carbamoyl-phosphate synthase small subunit [Corynebacterium uberis]UDL77108.1 glutamine-hydrolyzing carbamoyl-phosphate synthase small subunit [Corynebacterium uberis]
MTTPPPSGHRATPAVLVLADGTVFRGRALGATGTTLGEAVFSTAMTGYQETMTDPSYHRQIVTLAAPQVGNTGWNGEDSESHDGRIWVAGLVIRDLAARVSNWRATHSLEEEMREQGIVGIKGVDTRTLVRHLRNFGSIPAGIFSGADYTTDTESLVARVKEQPAMAGLALADDVSTEEVYEVPAQGEERLCVVAFDMGIKSNTPRNFAARGVRTIVVPAGTTAQQVLDYHPDGVFVSNGPGDPATADGIVSVVREVLAAGVPFFGICFGNQILGRALGLETYKLKFGHRGINVPVLNHDTGVIDITAQNHGFALKGEPNMRFDTDFGPAHVTHTCLNDDVVEGVALDNGMAFSVQYHPESAAGPHDAQNLFDQFVELMTTHAASHETA